MNVGSGWVGVSCLATDAESKCQLRHGWLRSWFSVFADGFDDMVGFGLENALPCAAFSKLVKGPDSRACIVASRDRDYGRGGKTTFPDTPVVPPLHN